MRIVLFDIDGTLLVSGGAGLMALRDVFHRRFAVEDAVEGIEFHGRTDPQILDSIAERHLGRALPGEERTELLGEYLEGLARFLDECPYRVLPGARELLEELSGRNDILLGLATGNVESGAWTKLRHGGLDGYFSFGGFGSDDPDRDRLTRVAVERGRERVGNGAPALVVGDTIHDVRSARAAGADCLAVATGNASQGDLEAAGARWTVPSLADPAVTAILAAD
ncbi:HAD hydrolase-like protein [bacterium]|nr:HAD hydrolase-like protein [bacterium]